MKAFRARVQEQLRRGRAKRRASARQAAIVTEGQQEEGTMNTRQLRRRSAIESSSSQSVPSDEVKQTPKGGPNDHIRSGQDDALGSPVISARSLRSANKIGQLPSPEQTIKTASTTSGRTALANNTSPRNLQVPDTIDTPTVRATRSSIKQLASPTQSESFTVSTRRASTREPVVKKELVQDEPEILPKSLRSSNRKKSVVLVDTPEETAGIEVAATTENLDSSQSSQKRVTRQSVIRTPDDTSASVHEEPSVSPKSLRSSAKVVVAAQAPLVQARREGNVIIISGIKEWPVEQKSLKITLKTSLQSGTGSSGRKRTRGQIDDLIESESTIDGLTRKRVKGVDTSPKDHPKSTHSQSSPLKVGIHGTGETTGSNLLDSFDSSQIEDINSRASRAARRSALLEAAGAHQADVDADDDDSSLSSAHTSQLGLDHPETSGKEPSETPPTPVSPNLLTEDSLPPAFLDFPGVEKPESAYPDKAAYLLAQRYAPLPPLSKFLAALTSHPPSTRSTETLLKLAANTQRALQGWQDEYLELDLKTCAVAGPIAKKPVTGGRKPIEEVKWQAAKQEELFGVGSRLSALARSRQATTSGQTRVMRERKARRGELDMLGGAQAGLAGSVPPSGAEDESKAGRAQRARKPVKRFEDAIADAEKAPSKRRKRGLGDDGTKHLVPAASASQRAKRGSNGTAKASDSDQDDDEAAKLTAGVSIPAPVVTTTGLPASDATQPTVAPPLNQQAPPYHPGVALSATPATSSTPSTLQLQHMQHQYGPPPPIHQYYHRQSMPPPGYGQPVPSHYTQPPQPPPGFFAQPPSVSYGNQPAPQSAYYSTPYNHSGAPHNHVRPPSHHQQPYGSVPWTSAMPPPGPAPGQSHPQQLPLPPAPARGKGQLPTGAPRKRAPKTTNAKGQPHEKSETRSASMTAWWAARKARMALEKDAALKQMAIDRAAAMERMRAGVPGGGISLGYGVHAAMPMGTVVAPPSATTMLPARPDGIAVPNHILAENSGTPAALLPRPLAPSIPNTPTRVATNTPAVASIPATPTKQGDAAAVADAPPPPRKDSLPPTIRRGSGSLGPGEFKGSTGMGGKRGML
jgi:hypothetical protein